MKQYLKVLTHYADFSGRANRKEYWLFIVFNILFYFLWQLTIALIIMAFSSDGGRDDNATNAILLVAGTAYNIAIFPAAIAVMVRRLHDTGRSAANLLLLLIPVVGQLWILGYMMMKGDYSANKYGNVPTDSANRYDKEVILKSAARAMVIAASTCIVYSVVSSLFIGLFSLGLTLTLFFHFILPVGLNVLLLCAGLFVLFSNTDMKNNMKNVAYMLVPVGIVRIATHIAVVMDMPFVIFQITPSICFYVALTLMSVAIIVGNGNLARYCTVFTVVFAALEVSVGVVGNSMQAAVMSSDVLYNVLAAQVKILLPLSLIVLSRAVYLAYSSGSYCKENSFYSVSLNDPELSRQPDVQKKQYRESDNRGMRIETFSMSQVYWLGERMNNPRKDPFVYYTFTNEADARAALLDLPFIHVAHDSGKMVCDDVFRFGCFEVTENGSSTGQYDAFVAGADLDRKMWERMHEVFTLHNGKFVNDFEPDKNFVRKPLHKGNPKNARFEKKTSNQRNTWMVYKAPSKADALSFLSTQSVNERLYYVIVETPEGNFGRDIDGFYQE